MEYKYLEEVKRRLRNYANIEQQDMTIAAMIEDVLQDMMDSGVPQKVAYSKRAIGTVFRGVVDLDNYSSGDVKYSPIFNRRIIQLSLVNEDEIEEDPLDPDQPVVHERCVDPISEEEIKETFEKVIKEE